MSESSQNIPHTLGVGLRALGSISECNIRSPFEFDAAEERWVLRISLRVDATHEFIPQESFWIVLVDRTYPLGEIKIYPAASAGITATFPHQERNTRLSDARDWRTGKLCLDSPFGGERYLTASRDPIGNAEDRLSWHVMRALAWLASAAQGTLLSPGDPFELPQRQISTHAEFNFRIVYDESRETFAAWRAHAGKLGRAVLASVPGLQNVLAVAAFSLGKDSEIRKWGGRPGDVNDDFISYWWLWPAPIIRPPWESPAKWGDLRQIGKNTGIDVDRALRELADRIRGKDKRALLLLGSPMPERMGEPNVEIHWDAILLPKLSTEGKPPKGFRKNELGWWSQDRKAAFSDESSIRNVRTENWARNRLIARGHLADRLQNTSVAIAGVGALGSLISEALVRAGLKRIAIIDDDSIEAGNVCRHLGTLSDVDKDKVEVVAKRLMEISPHAIVESHASEIPNDSDLVEKLFDGYDLVLDCTGATNALLGLAGGWWSIPKIFVSASVGYAARRLFLFAHHGNAFPKAEFDKQIAPWLVKESSMWKENGEVLQGIGCWSPIFPARYDDMVSASGMCVKVIEKLLLNPPSAPTLYVFEGCHDGLGFRPQLATTESISSSVLKVDAA